MSNLTVIIPIFGNNSNLDKTLYSLCHQNHTDFDVLIISNIQFNHDEYLKIIPHEFLYINEKNLANLLNYSLKTVKTKYISFLNCGDLLLFDSIKNRLNELETNPYTSCVYGLGFDINQNLEVKQNDVYETFYNFKKLPEHNIENILNQSLYPSLSSFIFKREIFSQISFNKNYNHNLTWDFFLKLTELHNNAICQHQEPVYMSAEFDFSDINLKNIVYKYLKESLEILDSFFKNKNSKNNSQEEYYRNIFWSSFFLVENNAPKNTKLYIYLLFKYLKCHIATKKLELDCIFITTLLHKAFSL